MGGGLDHRDLASDSGYWLGKGGGMPSRPVKGERVEADM